jgi:hypothetical protein
VTLPPGAHLGRYEILFAIGAGGMGEVSRARDPRLGRGVPIKVPPRTFSTEVHIDGDREGWCKSTNDALSLTLVGRPL